MELTDLLARATLVHSSGCFVWNGFINSGGYGRLRVNGAKTLAHRAAWALKNGPIPDDLCVLHKCDTPACINPNHLFIGTKADNNADKVKKSRQSKGDSHSVIMRSCAARGERQGRSKLTTLDVTAIRADKRSSPKVAKSYGVTHQCIQSIRNRKTWKCVS